MDIMRTGRLVLRTWRDEDEALFTKHLNTASIMKWIEPGRPLRGKTLTDEIQAFRLSQPENGYTFWVVERAEDAVFIGICGLYPYNLRGHKRLPEIGFRLRPEYQKHGYAREAAVATLNYAFGRLNVPSVVARVDARNEGSIRLLKRLGFIRKQDWEKNEPDWVMEKSSADWPSAQ